MYTHSIFFSLRDDIIFPQSWHICLRRACKRYINISIYWNLTKPPPRQQNRSSVWVRSEPLSPRITPGTGHCDKYFEICHFFPILIKLFSEEKDQVPSACVAKMASPQWPVLLSAFLLLLAFLAGITWWHTKYISISTIQTSDSNQVVKEEKATKGGKKRNRPTQRSKGLRFHRVGNSGRKGRTCKKRVNSNTRPTWRPLKASADQIERKCHNKYFWCMNFITLSPLPQLKWSFNLFPVNFEHTPQYKIKRKCLIVASCTFYSYPLKVASPTDHSPND